MSLIVIAGLPATGKTTLAGKIAKAFDLPILEKDEIKEEMFDTFGYDNLEIRRTMDLAANAILLRCTEKILRAGKSLLIVNNFDKDMSGRVQEILDRTGCKCALVFLSGDGDVLHRRYVERDRRNLRHRGHTLIPRYPVQPGDPPAPDMTREFFAERFEKYGMAEFSLNAPRIDLDATYPETVDVDSLIGQLKEMLF